MSSFGPSRLRLIPILIAQGVGVACGITGVKLNSRLIPPDMLGIYGVFLTLAPLGMWVVHAGLVKYIVRHWESTGSRPQLLRHALHHWARRLPWLALAAGAAAFGLTRLPGTSTSLAWLTLFPAAALLAFGAIAQGALQAERAHWQDCAVSVTGSLSRTFLPLLVFAFASGTLLGLWTGFSLHAVLVAGAGAWALRRYLRKSDVPGNADELNAVYRGPLFTLLAAAGWLLAGLNRWLVAGFHGDTEAGYFTLAGGAAVVVSSTLGAVFVQYAQPGFFALGDTPSARALLRRRVDQAALAYTVGGLAAIGLLTAVSPWLVGPLIDPQYRPALTWILPAGCFGVATITTVFYQSLLLAARRERACATVELSTAAVLTLGGVFSAWVSADWFARWLIVTPAVPWLLTRTLARRSLSKPDSTPKGSGR